MIPNNGAFDRQANVSPPDLVGRQEIFAVHTRSKPLGADVDLTLLARRTAGLTGADLANIANEAATSKRGNPTPAEHPP